jgi:hypothetical protein
MTEKWPVLSGTSDLEKLFGEAELNKSERRVCEALVDCAFSGTEA